MKKDWNHLSQREKAEYIRLGIKNGLDLQGTKQLYEYYQDQKNNQDYDMSAYLEDNKEQAFSHINGQHYPDTYKKPNHPTFSEYSIYNNVDGYKGGVWSTDGNTTTYTATPSNVYSQEELQNYFNKVEPNSKLIYPSSNNQR